MTNVNDSSIEEIVKKIIESERLSDIPIESIKLSDRLIKDLKMDGDDFSFIFVPEIELKFSVKIPIKAWRKVSTIEDVINVIKMTLKEEKMPDQTNDTSFVKDKGYKEFFEKIANRLFQKIF
jgi:acyl carrier protein